MLSYRITVFFYFPIRYRFSDSDYLDQRPKLPLRFLIWSVDKNSRIKFIFILTNFEISLWQHQMKIKLGNFLGLSMNQDVISPIIIDMYVCIHILIIYEPNNVMEDLSFRWFETFWCFCFTNFVLSCFMRKILLHLSLINVY